MKEASRKLLEKAERAIRASRTLLDTGDAEFAAGRSYYAMFFVAEALLHERDLQFRKHSAVHSAYGKEFAKTGLLDPRFHRWLLSAFNLRLQTDYSFEIATNEEEVEETLEQARIFLAAARDFLSPPVEVAASPEQSVAEEATEPAETTAEADDEQVADVDDDSAATDS